MSTSCPNHEEGAFCPACAPCRFSSEEGARWAAGDRSIPLLRPAPLPPRPGRPATLTAEEREVRDLAAQADPLDMIAQLMVAGYVVRPACEDCGGTGRLPCSNPRHDSYRPFEHACDEGRECPACATNRRVILLASIEADRLRAEREEALARRPVASRRAS